MKRAIVVFLTLVIVFAGLLSHQLGNIQAGSNMASDTSDMGYEYYDGEGLNQEETSVPDATTKPQKTNKLIEVDTKEDSVTVLVNREYRLGKDYIPADLVVPAVRFSFYGTYEKSYVRQVTADALEKLFAAGAKENVNLKAVSGYRSYARQKQIYDQNVKNRGEEKTDLVSAKPGSSEHQTGLSIDVSSSVVGCALEESFGDTTDGKWLAKNCHKYGFIIRYPKGKTDITGYSYEPWHIRYVGKKLATYLYKKDLTLEEYYETTTVDKQIKNPEGKIQDVAEDEKNEQEMTTAPTPVPDRKTSTTTRQQYSQVSATKAPVAAATATKKPASQKKPAAKATKKPTSQSSGTSKPQDAQSETPSTAQEPAQTQDSAQEPVNTTPEDASSEGEASESSEEEIDLSVE